MFMPIQTPHACPERFAHWDMQQVAYLQLVDADLPAGPLLICSLAVLQSIEDKERGSALKPGMIPSWAVPAIEGIPEAVQAASKAATQAAKDAVQSVVAAGSSSPTASEKVLCFSCCCFVWLQTRAFCFTFSVVLTAQESSHALHISLKAHSVTLIRLLSKAIV